MILQYRRNSSCFQIVLAGTVGSTRDWSFALSARLASSLITWLKRLLYTTIRLRNLQKYVSGIGVNVKAHAFWRYTIFENGQYAASLSPF